MTRFVLLILTIALGIVNIALLEHKPPNAGLPLVGATRDGQQAVSRYSADDPPQRYRSSVVTAKVTFLRGDALMRMVCGDPGFIACTDGRTGHIYVSDPCVDSGPYAQTLCHEIGHVLGWPGNHGP